MIQSNQLSKPMPLSKTFGVLIGFPIMATLLSLLLLNQNVFTNFGLDFFNTFWILIIIWYLVQIYIVSKILISSGWKWSDIGFTLTKRKTFYFIGGYLLIAFALLVFIELTLANSIIDIEKLNSISSLTPKTTASRVIFILMGLVAGLAEEIVLEGLRSKP